MLNRIHVLYTSSAEPYLYGAFARVHGETPEAKLTQERPFPVSRTLSDGHEQVYGTVTEMLHEVDSSIDKIRRFAQATETQAAAAEVSPSADDQSRPDSGLSDTILVDYEKLAKETLALVSITFRRLSEILPQLKDFRTNVYDYDNNVVSQIRLSQVSNLILDNRYLCIRGQYIAGIVSDERCLGVVPQSGLTIDILEYLQQVIRAINDISVGDLLELLRRELQTLSVSSNVNDVIFLHQHLYILGEVILERTSARGGPLESFMNKAAEGYLEKLSSRPEAPDTVHISLQFTTPRICWDPDLDKGEITITARVNEQEEQLAMDQEEFINAAIAAYGDAKLHSIDYL